MFNEKLDDNKLIRTIKKCGFYMTLGIEIAIISYGIYQLNQPNYKEREIKLGKSNNSFVIVEEDSTGNTGVKIGERVYLRDPTKEYKTFGTVENVETKKIPLTQP